MIRSLVGIISSNSIAIDLDAQNVIEAIQNTGITLSSTQILACHELINDLIIGCEIKCILLVVFD